MVGPDMAPQSGLALADFVTGGIAAPVLGANVQRVHMVSQVVFFVKYLPAHDADKLSAAGGQNLDAHVGVVEGCNTNICRFFSLFWELGLPRNFEDRNRGLVFRTVFPAPERRRRNRRSESPHFNGHEDISMHSCIGHFVLQQKGPGSSEFRFLEQSSENECASWSTLLAYKSPAETVWSCRYGTLEQNFGLCETEMSVVIIMTSREEISNTKWVPPFH